MAVVRNTHSLYYAAAGDVQAGSLTVTGFTWTGSTNAAHTMTFKNSAGTIVWGPFTAGIIGEPLVVMFPTPQYVDGLEVDVLGSGTVTVFLD